MNASVHIIFIATNCFSVSTLSLRLNEFVKDMSSRISINEVIKKQVYRLYELLYERMLCANVPMSC